MEEEYTIEDIKEMYEVSLKFPTESFGSTDFWKGLILAKAVGPHIKSLGSERASTLWRQIMKKTENNVNVFKGMLADYLHTKERNTQLSEKVENTLLDLFVRDVQLDLPNSETIKTSGKRQLPEDTQNIDLAPRRKFKVTTESRFPNLNLRLLIDENNKTLTQQYDDQDKYKFSDIPKTDNKEFIECYEKVLKSYEDNKVVESFVMEEINVKENNKKVMTLRRALKMFQQCYEKSNKEISEIYTGSNGDLKIMYGYLRGKAEIILWNNEDDEILKNELNTPRYEALVKKRGKSEVEKRIKYLQLFE